jgi:hypothetical protein
MALESVYWAETASGTSTDMAKKYYQKSERTDTDCISASGLEACSTKMKIRGPPQERMINDCIAE